jgi:hypothetical protein
MLRTICGSLLALTVPLAWSGNAMAQSLEVIAMEYPQPDRLPHIRISGISPVLWDTSTSTPDVTVADQVVHITIHPPDAGFSVIWGWEYLVALPQMQSGRYQVEIYSAHGSTNPTYRLLGAITPLIYDPRGVSEWIFYSTFEP